MVGHADGTIRVVEYQPRSRTLRTTEKPKGGGPIAGFCAVAGGRTLVTVLGRTAITISDLDGIEPASLDFAHGIPGRTGGSLAVSSKHAISPDGRLVAIGLQFPESPYLELVVWKLAAPRSVRHVSLAFLSGLADCASVLTRSASPWAAIWVLLCSMRLT